MVLGAIVAAIFSAPHGLALAKQVEAGIYLWSINKGGVKNFSSFSGSGFGEFFRLSECSF